jgi:hypothetical protein
MKCILEDSTIDKVMWDGRSDAMELGLRSLIDFRLMQRSALDIRIHLIKIQQPFVR